MNLIRRGGANVVYRKRRSCAADLRRADEALPVDGYRLCACCAELVDDAQQVVVVNDVKVGVLARLRRHRAVVETHDDAGTLDGRKPCAQFEFRVARVRLFSLLHAIEFFF